MSDKTIYLYDHYDYRDETDDIQHYTYSGNSQRKPITAKERAKRNKKNKQARNQRKR